MQKVFQALASQPRRHILAYLSSATLTAGQISERLDISKPALSKPALSKHLSILENAGLVTREKKGQFVHYSLVPDNLANTLSSYMVEVCPVSRPLTKESKQIANEQNK